MGLSKRYLDTKADPSPFDPDRLAEALEAVLPEVSFAYLHGSAAGGVVPPHSDLDLAMFVDPALSPDRSGVPGDLRLSLYARIAEVAESEVPGVRCDLGFLNGTEPVYRFEVLKGRLLFCRDRELWLSFYSLTCREYESQLFHYERQRRYRLEATR